MFRCPSIYENHISVSHCAVKSDDRSSRMFPFLMKTRSWSHIPKRYYTSHAPQNVYVTTPIFYVNAGPHIGHLYTAVLADIISRFNSMQGNPTFFCTGTDEHGTKVQKAAEAQKMNTPAYCDEISGQFREMCDTFQIGYSTFIRTTEERHRTAVHHFWKTLEEKGHIYLGQYSGWYCPSEEAFITEEEKSQMKDTSGVEWTEESNYKFRLSAFQDDLRHWLKNETTVKPTMYHKILTSWIEDGACLQDLSISRPKNRVPWAIDTPSDKTQTVYVWLDALVNYLTALGYPDNTCRQFWPPTVQVVGKDILKFHGVFWPAFLIAAGLEPPRTLFCHGHWMVDDQKMSKSKGNVISPFKVAQQVTGDGLRYFVARHSVPHSDSNYNPEKMMRILNSELADTLGNLANRCLGKALNAQREIPEPTECKNVLKSDVAIKNMKALETLSETVRKLYEEYNFHDAVDEVMNTLRLANRVLEHHKPWILKKQVDNPDSLMEMKAVLSLALENVRVATLILNPIIPKLSSEFLDVLQVPKDRRTWNDTLPLYLTNPSAGARSIGAENTVLFKKIINV